jgi:tetratricopeptide (TPR) repeat protein
MSLPSNLISPGLRRRLHQCYLNGVKLVAQEKYDCDEANRMFIECIVNDPGNLLYVEAFLDNLQRKYGNHKKRARFRFGGKGGLKNAAAKGDWCDVLRRGPDVLKNNPWDVATLRAMADACAALGHYEVELRYLQNALDANPKDVELHRQCAKSLARRGQFEQAILHWHRVQEERSEDEEALRMIALLTVGQNRIATKLDGEHHATPAGRESAAVDASRKAARVAPDVKSESEPLGNREEIPPGSQASLERAVAADPSEISNYIQLAHLLTAGGQFRDAEQVLTKALAVSPGNLQVRELLEDVQIAIVREQLAIAERQAELEPTEANRELAELWRVEVNQRELEVLSSRVQRYPNSAELSFNLARCLRRAGKYLEAVKYFAQTAQHPGRAAAANVEMGECLQYLRQFRKALDHYRLAVDAANDNLDCKKLALYRAAVLAQGLGELNEAETLLVALIDRDAFYKDAQARLDKIRQIRNKG